MLTLDRSPTFEESPMSRLGFVLVALATFVPSGRAAAPVEDPGYDELIAQAQKAFGVPGAAVVAVKDDTVVYLKGFGVRKHGSDEKVTPDTSFAIASCTKAFTATLLAMQAAEGKLSWDDRVRKHLDWFRLSDELADREVTLRDLFSHRSGMPRHDMLWAGLTPDTQELIRRWGKAKSSTSFRSTWEYSNVPFVIGGVVAGKVAKSDWPTLTRERLFAPLGMTASGVTPREALARPDHATPHYLGHDGVIREVGWDYLDSARPAGSINSTARDLGQWLRFHLAGGKWGGKQLIASRALKETYTPQMVMKPTGAMANFFPEKATRFSAYGLGWFVHDYRGHLCVSHGGTLTGFRAQCMLVPDKKVGVMVISNLRPTPFTEAVAKSVLDRLLGLPAEDWVKVHKELNDRSEKQVAETFKKREKERKRDARPSLALAGYAGAYEESAYGTATVSNGGDGLTLRWGKLTFRLEHYHFDTFTAVALEPRQARVTGDRAALEVQFRLDRKGEVESLTLYGQTFGRVKR
jgi:CubicO group peptidase (beta-lactamase class C family)